MSGRRTKRNSRGEEIAKMIMEQYRPENKEDMQAALKDIFGPMFEAMLQGEMDEHLGYSSNDHGSQKTKNRRNGYTQKKVKSSYGELEIAVPRDRESSFEPQVLYLRIAELYKKWNNRPVQNWALVRNQLAMDDAIQERIRKYENL